jgi:glycerophosphoryl diester phosphodiesterase
MPGPLTTSMPISSLSRTVLRDFWRVLKPLVVFEIVFKLAVLALGAPASLLMLGLVTRSTGTAAVTNQDIVEFVLSPAGALIVSLLGLSALLVGVLEHLGVMTIVARFQRGQGLTVRGITGVLAALMLPLLRLKIMGLGILLLLAAPLALLGGLAYAALLSRHDINYYLADRPPSFLLAIAIGGTLGAAFLAFLAYAYVRTVLIFPIVLYEDQPMRRAARESLRRTRGAFARLGAILLGWQVIGVFLCWGVVRGFAGLSAFLLHAAAQRFWTLVALVALLLAVHAVLLAALSFVLVAVHCLLILRLYRERNAALGLTDGEPADADRAPIPDGPRLASLVRNAKIAGLVSLAVFLVLCIGVSRRLDVTGKVIVTAHKGFSRAAPENSLSAIRRAIEAGADYAEIDVQETADGEVVLLHDNDLMRVAGDPRKIGEISLARARALDIGTKFSPGFAGERIPTLAEVVALARGRIKLQIELKFYGKERRLAEKVARLIEAERFESQCVVSSLTYDGLQRARRCNPRLRTAAIVTVSIGDIDRLDVDALSVNARNLSDRLIRAARVRHKEIYAWTVNEPRQMITLMQRGVSNIVTDAPDVLIRLRDEFAGLSDLERRLLAARHLLGLEPELAASDPDGEDPSP